MAKDILEELRSLVLQSTTSLMQEGVLESSTIPKFTHYIPEAKEHGDFAVNIALLLSKKTGRNPLEIAKLIASRLQADFSHIVAKAKAAPPGFINLFLSSAVLLQELNVMLKKGESYGSQNVTKKLVIEYSSPNIAKSFGIGHLRSTIIGQSLRNIHEFLGFECVGVNHLGDWGTPYGKLMAQIKRHILKGKDAIEYKDRVTFLSVSQLENLYVSFGKEAEDDPTLIDEARSWFLKLEQGDKEARTMWEVVRETSLKEFERVYNILGVVMENVMGESFYEDMLPAIIKEAQGAGYARESEGALIMEFPEEEKIPPAMLRKSDGASTYFTRDLAALKYRMEHWNPDLLILETGMEQALHFRQVFRAGELLGWTKDTRVAHVGHGMYRAQDGKFSTREGKTIHLEEVLQEAVSRARVMLEDSGTMPDFTEEEKNQVSDIVGIGGVKFNDLSQDSKRDIVFSWDKILNLKGDSAPYIQYTYARCKSILGKAGFLEAPTQKELESYTQEERDLLRLLPHFPSVMDQAVSHLSPHSIALFALDLARRYNAFYACCPVLQAENNSLKEFRLALTLAVSRQLKTSLRLLGIRVPERM